jgi:rubrerythrin
MYILISSTRRPFMAKEPDVTLAGLKTAIQMEIDGKEFYIKSSQTSTNEMGKKLLRQLAKEEDIHRKDFEAIFKNISSHKGWPDIKISRDRIQGLKTLFTEAIKSMDKDTQTVSTELDAVQKAMDMENKTFDFYKKRSGLATYSGEKELYEEIASQEKEHHRTLLDYFEFIKNPGAWFVEKEHSSVDGG